MSSRRFITRGEGLPQWETSINHTVAVNDTCYFSGQLSVDTSGKYVPSSILEVTGVAVKDNSPT